MRPDDHQHLQILSIFHYIVGGMAILFAFLPVFHLAFGIFMLAGDFPPAAGDDEFAAQIPQVMGCFLVGVASAVMLSGWAYGVCTIFAGRFLASRRKYLFCLVMAGISCMFMPFGTVLGVLTIVVLMRDGVKEAFGAVGAAA